MSQSLEPSEILPPLSKVSIVNPDSCILRHNALGLSGAQTGSENEFGFEFEFEFSSLKVDKNTRVEVEVKSKAREGMMSKEKAPVWGENWMKLAENGGAISCSSARIELCACSTCASLNCLQLWLLVILYSLFLSPLPFRLAPEIQVFLLLLFSLLASQLVGFGRTCARWLEVWAQTRKQVKELCICSATILIYIARDEDGKRELSGQLWRSLSGGSLSLWPCLSKPLLSLLEKRLS